MSISGYASSMSVAPGGRIGFYLSRGRTHLAEPHHYSASGTGSAPTNVAGGLSFANSRFRQPPRGKDMAGLERLIYGPAAWPTGFTSDCNPRLR